MKTVNEIKTKKGNRNFCGERPKEMSKNRYGVLINYYDWRAKNTSNVDSLDYLINAKPNIKALYYQFFEPLLKYGSKNNSTYRYITKKEVIINPVGELRAYRYFITKDGKQRLKQLKDEHLKRIKNKSK